MKKMVPAKSTGTGPEPVPAQIQPEPVPDRNWISGWVLVPTCIKKTVQPVANRTEIYQSVPTCSKPYINVTNCNKPYRPVLNHTKHYQTVLFVSRESLISEWYEIPFFDAGWHVLLHFGKVPLCSML